ncbi:MAG: isopentenyl phosphate kinase [Candidatus Micrarchaeota archaeon]
MELVLIKLGGSLITNKFIPFTANEHVIDRLSHEIHEARKKKKMKIVLGHGGGSFPHTPAHKYQVQKGFKNERSARGFAETQEAASLLNRIVVKSLLDEGESAVSFQPSACAVASNGRIVEWDAKPIELMLKMDVLPVVYGDVAVDNKKGCSIISTEEILCHLARKLRADRVVVVGKTDGVYTDDPLRPLKKITPKNYAKIKKYLGGSDATDVTGGMRHKVERLLELARGGIPSEVISGMKKENLLNALLNRPRGGTKITK